MLAAIGHDLRTPITRLRLRTESIGDTGLRGALVRDLDHMDGMVHTALSFLRDGHAATPMQPLDFASLLQTICDDFTDTGSSVLYEGPDRMLVVAHSEDLRRLFTNLVGNAVVHGREVIVTLKQLVDRDVEVDVADDGPGIAENDKIRALTPFWRSAASHVRMDGFGLGLSIVRAIAEAHEGSVILVDGAAGGLVCRVQLPIGSIEAPEPRLPKQVEEERSRASDTV